MMGLEAINEDENGLLSPGYPQRKNSAANSRKSSTGSMNGRKLSDASTASADGKETGGKSGLLHGPFFEANSA
ncbi:hypothetical protein L596_013181 [Steinernema carpocapsae]|uniref:Uncharacterized protein n=1 Tax=Steinernema carpocapsae TaxID=34508 RepID=A0A4U5NZW2_STECR|nr:hypothetical protein L596_013181 [Steinernema carpocapsae]